MLGHERFYEEAALYDLAFSYRDYGKEVAFLRDVFRTFRPGEAPKRFLELAAGPARHALEMAATGTPSMAIDLSAPMKKYGTRIAKERGVALDYRVADMETFEVRKKFDFAACMLCSATYLLDDAAVDRHLKAVARALLPGGLYVLELPHPAGLEGESKTKHQWDVEGEGGVLSVEWNEKPEKASSPYWRTATQAVLAFRPAKGRVRRAESTSLQRYFSVAELEAAVQRSRVFTLKALYGALDQKVALEAPKAWRMLVVLQKGRRAS